MIRLNQKGHLVVGYKKSDAARKRELEGGLSIRVKIEGFLMTFLSSLNDRHITLLRHGREAVVQGLERPNS